MPCCPFGDLAERRPEEGAKWRAKCRAFHMAILRNLGVKTQDTARVRARQKGWR